MVKQNKNLEGSRLDSAIGQLQLVVIAIETTDLHYAVNDNEDGNTNDSIFNILTLRWVEFFDLYWV